MEQAVVFEANYEENIFNENEEILIQAADQFPWPEVEKDSKQARVTAYMMRRHQQMHAKESRRRIQGTTSLDGMFGSGAGLEEEEAVSIISA